MPKPPTSGTDETNYDAESPETRARLDRACRPWDDTRSAHAASADELFGPNTEFAAQIATLMD